MITNIPVDEANTVSISFDLDYTLIKTKSGKKFPKDKHDWIGMDSIINNIKHDSIIIFTNQSGKITDSDLYDKLENIEEYIINTNNNIKYVYYIASRKHDKYRKPNIGMVNYIKNYTKLIISPDMLYIGDAAGRPNDFSCSDRAFANNCKFNFQTPEEFIGGAIESFKWTYIPPSPDTLRIDKDIIRDIMLKVSSKSYMIIFIGYPGSGKSTFYKLLLEDFSEYINRDTLKTKAKCIQKAKDCSTEYSIVIDNTNPTRDDRKEYIKIAKDKKMDTMAIWIQNDYNLSQYLAFHREIINSDKDCHIPSLVYNKYRKNFQEPTMDEGFDYIYKINGLTYPHKIDWSIRN